MDLLISIGINLIVAVISFTVGGLWSASRRWWRLRHARRFWRDFLHSGFTLVMPRYLPNNVNLQLGVSILPAYKVRDADDASFSPEERLGFMGAGEAEGLMEISAFFRQLGVKQPSVAFSDTLSGDALQANLLVVGGPDANELTVELLARLPAKVGFSGPPDFWLVDSATNTVFRSAHDDDHYDVIRDYALIIRGRSPYNHHKSVIVAAGRYSYGTWAAMRFLASPDFLRQRALARMGEFEALIGADIARVAPQEISFVVPPRPLSPR